MKKHLSFLALILSLLHACSTETRTPPVNAETPEKPTETAIIASPLPPTSPNLKISKWSELIGWTKDNLLPAWEAFLPKLHNSGQATAMEKKLYYRRFNYTAR